MQRPYDNVMVVEQMRIPYIVYTNIASAHHLSHPLSTLTISNQLIRIHYIQKPSTNSQYIHNQTHTVPENKYSIHVYIQPKGIATIQHYIQCRIAVVHSISLDRTPNSRPLKKVKNLGPTQSAPQRTNHFGPRLLRQRL